MSNTQIEEMQEERSNRHLAVILGITYEELCQLDFNIDDNTSNDGMIYSHTVVFKGDLPVSIMKKIDGLSPDNTVDIGLFDNADSDEAF